MTSRVTNCCKKSIWQTCDKVWQYIFPGAERHAHSTLSVQKNRNERIKWSSLFSGPCGPCVWWCSKSALGCLDLEKWFYFFNLSSVVLSFWKSCLWNILELGSLNDLGLPAPSSDINQLLLAKGSFDMQLHDTMWGWNKQWTGEWGKQGIFEEGEETGRRGGNATSEARISSKNVSPAAEYVEGAPSWDLYLRKKSEQENRTLRKRNGHLWQGSKGYESDLQRNSASM